MIPAAVRPRARWLLVVAVMAFCSHLPALWGDFVFDDLQVALGDPHIYSWRALPQVFSTPTIFFLGVASVYRPISSLSWGLDMLTWGQDQDGPRAMPFHLTNLLLHAATAVLLILVLFPILGERRSIVAGAVFAVHPATVEDVAWVVGRADVLALLFGLAALLALRLEHRWWRLIVVSLLAVASFGAKEIGILLPVAMVLWAATVDRQRWRELLPTISAATAAVLLMLVVNRTLVAGAPSFPLLFANATIFDRLHIACTTIGLYTRILLWPYPLTVEYFWPGAVAPPLLWVVGVAVIATTAITLVIPRTRRIGLWLGLILAALSPVIHLMPFFELAAERYLYVPMVGFAALVAMAWHQVARRWAPVATILLAALLSTWTAMSITQCMVWMDQITLFEHAVKHAPLSPLAHNNLADAYLKAGFPDRAATHWEVLVRIHPVHLQARYDLARYRMLQGRLHEARELLGLRDQWLDDKNALELWQQLNPGN